MGSKQSGEKDVNSKQENYLVDIQRKVCGRDKDRILFIENILKQCPKVISSTYKGGFTLLHLAVCKNDPKVVNFLLGKMDVRTIKAINFASETALDIALKYQYTEIIELLKSHATFSATFTPTLSALAKRGDVQNLTNFLTEGVDVNFIDQSGVHPLQAAVEEGYIEIVKLLLEYGAYVNFIDQSGAHPLHTAVKKEYTDIVKLLLEYGAYVNFVDQSGVHPLHTAVKEEYTDIVKLLLEYGAYVNFIDQSGTHPLHTAVKEGYLDIVKLLLEYGAYVDFIDQSGHSLLQKVVISGDYELAQIIAKTSHTNIINAVLEWVQIEEPDPEILKLLHYELFFRKAIKSLLCAELNNDCIEFIIIKYFDLLESSHINLRKIPSDSKDLPNLLDDAQALNKLGFKYGKLGGDENILKSLNYMEQALEIYKQLYQDQAHPNLVNTLYNVGFTYKKLGQDTKSNEYIKQAKEMRKALNRNPEGEGLENYESVSYWNKYSKEGIEQLLKLRMESADIQNIIVKSFNAVWNDSTGVAERLCSDIMEILDTERGLVISPLNMYAKHWVGIVIDKSGDKINIHYMDPEQQATPALFKQKLTEVLTLSYPEYRINLIETELQPQKYNNCGPEVIENFIWYLTGSRFDQDDVVLVHNLLFEDAIMLAGLAD